MLCPFQLWVVSAVITIVILQLCYSGLSTFTNHVKLDIGVLEHVVWVFKDLGNWVSVRGGIVGVCKCVR